MRDWNKMLIALAIGWLLTSLARHSLNSSRNSDR